MNHPLVILSSKIPWNELEKELANLYSHTGLPSKPVRLMAGLLILKQMYNHGDETIMSEWVRDPYFQHFCGEAEFQWTFPCDPSDLVHFRKRIGKEGVEKLLALSVQLQGKDAKSRDVIVDSTVQEKNITFPTDAKLYRKIVSKCNKIAETEGIELRQSYSRTMKKLLIKQRFAHHPKRKKEAAKALRKMRTIAGRITRDLERKLQEDKLGRYQEQINLFTRVIHQKRHDKDKIYSLHEPEVACIAKGKAHKPYEFGSKVSFAMLPKSNIIVGVVNFKGNPHDSKTLKSTLDHCFKITGREFENAIVDRGYPGKKQIGNTNIVSPGSPRGKSEYEKRKKRKQCRSRAAIEPVIGHIKQDCRMVKNYLKGSIGDEINAILAATALNFRRLLRKIERQLILPIFQQCFLLLKKYLQIYFILKTSY